MFKILLIALVVTKGFSSIDSSIQTNTKSNNNTKISQQKIDKLSEKERVLFLEYRNQLKEIETLKTYNQQLKDVIDAQEEEKLSLDQQIVDIEITQQRIMPLMSKMISSLNTFVAQDIPFLPTLREDKQKHLDALLAKSNLTVSQKYRYIIEAYGIELEYGRTIETYEGKLNDGESVHFLRIGRTGLYYLSHDKEKAGIYNPNTKKFQKLDSSYIKQIRTGIKIARKQLAPQLLKLPVVATKEN
jgi:hypothetical protein